MKKMTLVSALFFLFIFIFSLPVSYAQTGKITGYVLDKQIGAPIIGANVVIEGTERGAATGIDGDFVILTVQPGTYTLKASAVGYSSVKIKDVVVSIDSTITIKFVLESGPGHFENCAVTYKNPLVDITLSSKVERITSESLDSYPSDDAYGALYGSLAYLGLPKNFNTEEFSHLTLNSWQAVNTQPLSTFSVDVDNASYTIMRQSVSNSMLPPPESVRIEEYINYFNYNYEAPTDEKPFSLTMEQSECPWNKNHGMLLIGIKGKEIDISEAPPSNFVFLIDNSGSMDHPNKSPLLKKGMKLLVNELRPVDRVSIVTYAGNPGLVLPSTPGNEKESISRALDSFRPGGFTGGAAGIKLAYKIAKENFVEGGNNRVILATDGDFNVGLSSVG